MGVPTLSVTTITFRTPVEPGPHSLDELAAHHTNQLTAMLPVGFKVVECADTPDYTCAVNGSEVSWTRKAGSTDFGLQTVKGVPQPSTFGGFNAVEWFDVTVRTPGIGGTFSLPARQTYNDGEQVDWNQASSTDPHPAPQLRVNGPDRAPVEATGFFKPLAELGGGNPCPQSVIDEAAALGIDPAEHCAHFGFEPPAGSSAPPPDTEPKPEVRGTATLTRSDTQTVVEVLVSGLEPGKTYMAHLHEGTCADPTSAHYRDDPAGSDGPPNELWPSSDPADPTAGLIADENGVARGSAVADWVARPTARAIWIHDPEDPDAAPGTHVHTRIGCAD
ncbi:MAG TPA: DUF1775 domain-containing protein, partial [Acidimicrobiia bacterium]|nr:DUF1775 domain-containing protein [Acidimicrobiia bacterium]